MSVQTTAVLLIISIAIPYTLGVFDGRDDSGPRPGDQFPVTGNLLQCHDSEPGVPLTVGAAGSPGEVFKPHQSRYRYPTSLENIASIIIPVASIINQLNISDNMTQRITSEGISLTEIVGLPFRYRSPDRDPNVPTDRVTLERICGADVLAVLNDSNRNADQPEFSDITGMWQARWLEIFDNLTAEEQRAVAGRSTDLSTDPVEYRRSVTTDQEQAFSRMLQALTCKVAFRWTDAGPTFLPRYFFGGFCLNRKCSLPDRDEFRCHADLSEEAVRYLEAARWDCCWTYSRQMGYQYQCGFRKIRFPIICDCDCRCMDKAGI